MSWHAPIDQHPRELQQSESIIRPPPVPGKTHPELRLLFPIRALILSALSKFFLIILITNLLFLLLSACGVLNIVRDTPTWIYGADKLVKKPAVWTFTSVNSRCLRCLVSNTRDYGHCREWKPDRTCQEQIKWSRDRTCIVAVTNH